MDPIQSAMNSAIASINSQVASTAAQVAANPTPAPAPAPTPTPTPTPPSNGGGSTPVSACLTPSTTPYSTYIANCMNIADTQNMNNLITKQDFQDLLSVQEALATDTITKLQNIKNQSGQDSQNVQNINNTVRSISQQVTDIENEITDKKNKIEAMSQDFMESLASSPKKVNTFGNIQDIALAAFFISFILLIFTLSFIQYSRPGGSALVALYTFIALVILFIVIYAILQQVV